MKRGQEVGNAVDVRYTYRVSIPPVRHGKQGGTASRFAASSLSGTGLLLRDTRSVCALGYGSQIVLAQNLAPISQSIGRPNTTEMKRSEIEVL